MKHRRIIVGSLAITIGVCLLLSIPYFFLQSQFNTTKLLQEYNQQASLQSKNDKQGEGTAKGANQVEATGKLLIPSIALETPIVEGTEQDLLIKGAGHLSTSVMPGINGTSVIAAHNVTFFHNLGQVKLNDRIQVQEKSGTHTFVVYATKIVKAGDPIYNTETPSLVLETCYPFNAMNLTPYRYLVFGSLSS